MRRAVPARSPLAGPPVPDDGSQYRTPAGILARSGFPNFYLDPSLPTTRQTGTLSRPALEAEVQFTVGLKLQGKSEHLVMEAEDALIAALKAKVERPEALITYVRKLNRRGDARHPARHR